MSNLVIESKTFPTLLVSLSRELARYGNEAWALYQAKDGMVATSRSKTQHLEQVAPSKGVVFTLRVGERLFEGATAKLDEESLNKTVQELVRHTRSVLGNLKAKKVKTGSVEKKFFEQEGNLADLDPQDLMKQAKAAGDKLAKLDKRIAERVIRLGVYETVECFANGEGYKVQKLIRSERVAFLIFNDGDHQSEIFGGGSEAGLGALKIPTSFAKKLVEDGLSLLGAQRLKPGSYRCILSPSVAGMLAHEAFGHGMEADMFVRGRGRGEHYMGQKIAGDSVSMVDSPALPGHAASYFFDHEGREATHTEIIHEGVLKAPISDKISALRLDIDGSSNGRRESVFHKTYTRMTNTYFDKGTEDLAGMLKKLGNGLYIDYATNGMEDPKSWGIQVEALMAREVKNGAFTGKVFSPVIMTGYVPDILRSIDMVGKDLHIGGLGFCGKGHKEWVKVTDGGPHISCTARIA